MVLEYTLLHATYRRVCTLALVFLQIFGYLYSAWGDVLEHYLCV